MKTHHEISGYYFRQQNPETKKWENVCFEDLEPEEQKRILGENDAEWIRSLTIGLADTVHRLAEQFDIFTGSEEEPITEKE